MKLDPVPTRQRQQIFVNPIKGLFGPKINEVTDAPDTREFSVISETHLEWHTSQRAAKTLYKKSLKAERQKLQRRNIKWQHSRTLN